MSIDMNTLISGGTVTVEDGLKAKEDYAPARKVIVAINFSVPEGLDGNAILTHASNVADKQVRVLLGKAPAAPPADVKAETPATPAKSATTRKKAPEAPAEPAKTKAELAKEAGLPTESIQHKGETAPLVDELDEAPAKTAAAKPADDDDLGDLLGAEEKPPVTDAELGKAAQEKNGEMKGKAGWAPEKIRELVGKFVLADGKPKPGAKLQEIPAAQRHDFLAQLKALK